MFDTISLMFACLVGFVFDYGVIIVAPVFLWENMFVGLYIYLALHMRVR